MTIEADMSRPSKRFVLPYEPEYTAHRTDRRVERAMQLHRLARQHVTSPGLVPNADPGTSTAADQSIRHDQPPALQSAGFPRKN